MSSLIYERDAFILATLLQGLCISHCQETPWREDKFILCVAYWTWEYKWQRSKQKDARSLWVTHKYSMHEECWDRVSHFSNRHGSCLVTWFFLLSPTVTYKGKKTPVSTALKVFRRGRERGYLVPRQVMQLTPQVSAFLKISLSVSCRE